ncbi:reverse transcriptase domain-containing protein [Brevundimonas sp. G8]|uniref:reverse transcriptase domain-containing protein n=1 Tax=Brevundimonas sp. G8 TaxID=1350776 RepID=UPI00135A32C4|nr:reverse transcriptase domain-containing protein [Brevundimonas sp. G8]
MRQLALLLNVDYGKTLSFALYRANQTSAYRAFSIPKRDGSERIITAPKRARKSLQQSLLPLLEQLYDPAPCVHGAVKGRSVKTNAAPHVARRYILNVDIDDFFPTIHFKRVVGILSSSRYGVHPTVATAVAQICCHQGRLPTGAPTSPILANMVCGKLDSALLRLAKKNKLRYTRYYDDITLSSSTSGHLTAATGIDLSSDHIAHGADRLSDEFKDIFTNNGFSINSKKVWGTTRKVRQQVTGLVVNKKHNVPIAFVRSTRAMIHSIEKMGIKSAQEKFLRSRKDNDSLDLESHISGRLAYIGYITDYGLRYTTLAKRFMAVSQGTKLPLPLLERERSVYVAVSKPGNEQATAFHVGHGFFVTAAHLVDPNKKPIFILVHSPDYYESPIATKIVHINYATDVALLKNVGAVAVNDRPAIKLTSRQSSRGDQVEAYGFENYIPGNKLGVVKTEISSVRQLDGQTRHSVSAPWPHGMSGGPVFDTQGVFLGIVFSGPLYGEKISPYGTAFTPSNLFAAELEQWLIDQAS